MNNRWVPPVPPNQRGFIFPRSEQEYIEQQNFIRQQYERNTGIKVSSQPHNSSGLDEIQKLQNPHKK